jgi:hypothetical protein
MLIASWLRPRLENQPGPPSDKLLLDSALYVSGTDSGAFSRYGTHPVWSSLEFAAGGLGAGLGSLKAARQILSAAPRKTWANHLYRASFYGDNAGIGRFIGSPRGVAGLADDAVELAAQRRLVEMTGNTPYAHYLGKHSPLVSDQALIARATTGLDPWEGIVKTYQKGKKAGQPILSDSTRFNSYQDMLESIEKAQRALGARFPNGGIPANGAMVTMDMLRDVGLGYGKGTGTLKTGLTRVRVHFDQYGQVISGFPLYK